MNLVQVWTASDEQGLRQAERRDMFVRDAGSTTSRVGFHRLLAEFVGWNLPMVPNFSGTETRLYLEVLFPLFYIEQKYGWSGIGPRIPTHYGIREPLRRGVEFTLGLHTLERIRQADALREEAAAASRQWASLVSKAQATAQAENFRISYLQEKPTGRPQRRNAEVEANINSEWHGLQDAEAIWRRRLSDLRDVGMDAGARTTQTREQLADAEREVQRLSATARNLHEQLNLSASDEDAIVARLSSLAEDKRRLQDLKKIVSLGGELELPLLSEGRCPTCSQEVDGRLVATETVTPVEENISLLDSERLALQALQNSAATRTANLARSLANAEASLSEARDRVRLLRDELIGPSNAPSIADIQERLVLEGRLRAATHARRLVAGIDEELDELAEIVDDTRARRANLDSNITDAEDRATLQNFRRSFQQQLAAYNLRSLSPESVSIDDRTLLPVNDGFELTFDVAFGISASDTIRTKWAYYAALLETAISAQGGRHLGLLMLDEPRQQETDRDSLAAFLHRLRYDSRNAQIVYATSEDPTQLERLLAGIPHTKLPANGRHLIDF
ncbi:hypothetical protein [Actinoplanes sp. TBRC 11911]|uniref:hypothetical protein n=1 Tax=Actinoplanes sp. TBRC 11911 TaxID=2729386 RepID=UPI0020071A3E|nr:hypothetical protein [Actinoplanes sp. TBRC 11911]